MLTQRMNIITVNTEFRQIGQRIIFLLPTFYVMIFDVSKLHFLKALMERRLNSEHCVKFGLKYADT